MPLIPDTPAIRKIAAVFLALCLGFALWQAIGLFTSHRHVEPKPVLLYDLERKVLAEYPPGTRPGSFNTAALKLFAKEPQHENPKAGMTLEDLEKAGLRPGWLYRLDETRRTGLYADPRQPGKWMRSDEPTCQAQLNRWVGEAAAFSSTKQPIPCRD